MPTITVPEGLPGVRPPASSVEVAAAHEALPSGLNAQLRALFESCDGFLTDSGIAVYETADVAERNVTFEVAEYAPGFVLFGDDSGGRGFLLHVATPDSPVYVSDLGDLDPTRFEVVCVDLASWIAGLR
ncbi:hypothetical protein [Microbacterium sp.]|uniref:hypothetical protein n=1 Tax=Microbacterium sp. TaxID=51671 RepID=UPI002610CA17|nr:hypothetical protein [Microbacterium sp.]